MDADIQVKALFWLTIFAKNKYKDKGKGKSFKKGYRAFTAGSSLEDDSTLSSEDNEEEKVRYETAALSKELTGKPLSFVIF